MPYSHSTSLVLRDPPPVTVVTVAFAPPRSRHVASTFPPRCRGGQSEQCRMRDGARTATLGHSRPFQAVMWGLPGQLAAGRPRFNGLGRCTWADLPAYCLRSNAPFCVCITRVETRNLGLAQPRVARITPTWCSLGTSAAHRRVGPRTRSRPTFPVVRFSVHVSLKCMEIGCG